MSGQFMQRDEEMGLSDQEAECQPLMQKGGGDVKVVEQGGTDIVQFSSARFFADEEAGHVKVDVIRLGTILGRVAAQLATKDGSAIDGQQYQSVSANLVFEEGEHIKCVEIPIVDDGYWTATREFEVRLTRPQNCVLSTHLDACRVKILNCEAFPSDVYKDDIEEGPDAIKKIGSWGLFWEYCLLNFHSTGQKWQTILIIVCDQLASLVLFGTLWVGVYMVDTLFGGQHGHYDRLLLPSRNQTLVLISMWYVIPICVLYSWDALKAYLDVKGASREFLQTALMSNSLDYTPESRNRVTSADMNVAMGTEAEQIAAGYTAGLNILGLVGRIVAICLFIFLFNPDTFALYSVLGVVSFLLIFIVFRASVVQEAALRVEEKWLLMETLVEETHGKYRLLSDYNKRGLMSDMFHLVAEDYSKAKLPDTLIHLNTQYVTKLLTGCVICNYIVQRAPLVFTGHLPLGIFLATVSVFTVYLAEALMQLNCEFMTVMDSFGPLKEFTEFLNLPLELADLQEVNLERRRQTASLMKEGAKLHTSQSDDIPIVLSDVSFEYTPDVHVLKNINLSIKQGQMLAVSGPHHSGKSTFVQLLAGILPPTSGSIFFPAHLRVLHVSREPIFLRASLLHNLFLGLPDPSASDEKRANEILTMLGLEEAIQLIEAQKAEGLGAPLGADSDSARSFVTEELYIVDSETSWDQTLTLSFKVKLHIARALIADPEVIVLDRCLQPLNEESANLVLEVLHQHVENKGICLPLESKSTRRPRTVFFSSDNKARLAKADCILNVDISAKNVTATDTRGGLLTRLTSTSKSKGEVGCLPLPRK